MAQAPEPDPADFVALALNEGPAGPLPLRLVIARGDSLSYHSVALAGHEETLAQTPGRPQVENLVVPDLAHAAGSILDLAGEVPWVAFDQDEALGRWRAADLTGVLSAYPVSDAGDLAVLAMPWSTDDTLAGFVQSAGALLPNLARTAKPALGFEIPAALADLWRALPDCLASRPYALRAELVDLLARAGSPLAGPWRAAAAKPPASVDEPRLLDSLLRSRLREMTPDQVGEANLPTSYSAVPLDAVDQWFAPDGALAAGFERWEPRPGQRQMAQAVASGLNDGQLLIVEAGTGTGKSLAYLAPAALFALRNESPVIISTATRNLQDQLCEKDLPRLEAILDQPLRIARLKGRNSYLCVERLLDEYHRVGTLPFDDSPLCLAYLLSWAASTESGDTEELSGYLEARYPELRPLAGRLASDAETCTTSTARGHPCFATVARRRAGLAHLVVTNHALTLANTEAEVLPKHAHLIIDEAHQLEDVATEAFGLLLEKRALLRLTRQHGGALDRQSWSGRLRAALDGEAAEATVDVRQCLDALAQAAGAVNDSADELGARLADLVMARLRLGREGLVQTNRLRLVAEDWAADSYGQLGQAALGALLTQVQAVGGALASLVVALQVSRASGALGSGEQWQQFEEQAQNAQAQWAEQAATTRALLSLDDESYVYWLETTTVREALLWRLRAAPVEPGRELVKRLYSQLRAVVLTSATLQVGRSFDFVAERLGLLLPEVAERYHSLSVPSPFDYQRSVLLCVPTNIALPNDERFEDQAAVALRDVALLLQGRTLALFTSRRALRSAHERLAPELGEEGIDLLCQGVSGSRAVIAERFRRHQRAVLMGTRSFWEGIDVPGEALSCVVIVKLPFTMPNDPVHVARCERLEARGINAWAGFSVPQAVLQFKQGFGRLIRTDLDRGAVICLDRRLVTKGYGRAFLDSVPGYTSVIDRWSECRSCIADWLVSDYPM